MLGDCLDSLLASVEVDLQVVVVLNGCDEALPDIVEQSDCIHSVQAPEPLGFSAANNLGVAWADEHLGPCSSYYFVNNDTVSEPEALACLAETIEEGTGTGAAGPQLLIQWAPDHLNSLGLNVTVDGWGWDEGIGIRRSNYGSFSQLHEVIAVTGSALLVRKDVFHAIGGWTELYDYYFEDIDLCLKIRRAGWAVVNQPAAVVYHAVSATSGLDSQWKLFLFWRNRLLLAMLHWPLGLLLTKVAPIVLIDEIVGPLWQDCQMQRKALMGAIKRLPRIVRLRFGLKGKNREWVAMLKPAGSVPVISLPEPPKSAEDDSSATEVDHEFEEAIAAAVRWRQAECPDTAVAILGTAPLPFEQAKMNYAPGSRTWQFARGLAARGFKSMVLCERMAGGYDEPGVRIEVEETDGAMIVRLSAEDFHTGDVVPRLLEAFDPTCLVGASARPSGRAVSVAKGRPVWVDLFGDPMAEAQARAARCPEGDQLTAYRDLVATLVENGDTFSVVSGRQRDAALGQLGLLGRLNRQTAGLQLVHVIPCSADPGDVPLDIEDSKIEYSALVPDDAFVVLWSGGFNTWCDVKTMAAGVEGAMKAESELHLVVTGGAITGHDDLSWREWLCSVAASEHADRLHLLGSLPTQELSRWFERADLGLITEKVLHEREFGSSGRVAAWLAAGLPFVATAQSELVQQSIERGVAFAYTAGDSESLTSTLVSCCRSRSDLVHCSEQARAMASTFAAEPTTEPLARWVQGARLAPDKAHGDANPLSHWALSGALTEVLSEREVLRRERAHLRAGVAQRQEQLTLIHTSAMWRTWAVLRRIKAIVTYPWRRLRGRTGG